MNKRRRAGSVASRQDDDSDDNESLLEMAAAPVAGASTRKKKKLDPTEQCQHLYEILRNFKKEDGTSICDTFIRAPKRRQEPSYYDVVSNPIDLLKVQHKMKSDAYDDIMEFTEDIELIVNNAKAFYKQGTSEYQDACTLWDVFQKNKKKLEDEEANMPRKIERKRRKSANNDEEESDNNEIDAEVFEDLFVTIMNAIDPMDNRQLNTQFQLLPSKKLYPDYYDVIDYPIDLRFIANKIQTSAYTSINDIERDLFQMTKNACTFNEPGSQIYKDAKMLRKVFMSRKAEIETGKYKKVVMKKSKSPQSLSATIAALKEAHHESSDDEMDDAMESEGDGPLWQLFDQLYNTANSNDTNNAGAPLGESLWKLPNRRFHPEYYEKVKHPISMSQIRHKLKRGHYNNITDMTADLYQMLDNAKKAFLPTNKVYKDALKMTKILNQRLVEDTGDLEESDTEDTDSSSLPSVLTTPVVGEKRKKGRPKNNPVSSPGAGATSTPVPKGRPPNSFNLKKKLAIIQQFLTEFSVNNRRPMELFMEKPSKKIYPDYYRVIQHPIDMNTIEANIKAERYTTLDDIVGDYRLMFSNCRKYNEEGSMIYEDANMLERALNEKLKEFSRDSRRLTPKSGVKQRKMANPSENKLRSLYDAIRDYREPKQSRQLALIFMKLPSKNDYPDYYDIIKQPIDMEKIAHKLKQQGYDNIDELSADFNLMFDNACKYNEPDSQIYKDALCLQQVCLQTKQLLKCNEDSVPDVQQAVQEILLLLFTSFYNCQDEEGRCYSDSLAELPEHDENDGVKVRGISLDLIKRRLDKGLYRRLDQFQEDIFLCLERARKLTRTDSQVFEDSIELQSFFIKKRDELCRNGDGFQSPALSYTAMHLSASVEALRQSKLLQEEESETESDSMTPQNGESMTIDQKVFSPGDFVYFELPENKIPGIIFIERLWTNQDNVKMCYGNVFLRPYETYHVQTRRFMEQEVFKSDQHQAVQLAQLQSKCYVMSIKDYFKMKPEGFADKDIYVCESRYTSRARSFKKIKNWNFNPVQLVAREKPLEIKRVMSVFKDRVEKHKVELAELQLQEALVEKEKPNVVVFASGGEEGNTYYEQYNTVCSGVVKTGDFVYVATESGKQSIAQITSIWETKDGKSFFRGPWLLTPPEVPGTISQKFYRQEVLLSTVQETTPMVGIVGRCAVLEQLDYCTRRPTEIAESDVYMCESVFDEMKKQIKKMQTLNGLNKFTHSQMVTPDEIYRFPRPINFARVSCGEIVALQENRPIPSSDMEFKTEGDILGMVDDSVDGPPSIGSDIATASPLPTPTPHFTTVATPVATTTGGGRRTGKGSRRLVTGYILYSSGHRKGICASNPEATFGDISRMVGLEWKALPEETRRVWEEKAARLNEENAIKYAEANALLNESGCPSPVPDRAQPATVVQEILPNQVYECCWDKCDYQFEDPADLMEHCIADTIGCVHKKITCEADYICIWRNCVRLKRSAPPFPNVARLIKHVREVHVVKNTGRNVEPYNRNKNYVASKRQSVQQPLQTTIQTIQTQATNNIICTNLTTSQTILASQNVVPNNNVNTSSVFNPEPLFVTVPPRPQRVLHSEAYLKYIESLNNDTPHITPWEKTLKATKETVSSIDVNRLPTHWLGKRGKEKPEEVVDAIWQLREFMMKDVIKFNQY